MKNGKTINSFFFLFFFTILFMAIPSLTTIHADTRFIVNTGHQGEVTDMRVQQSSDRLVSVGKDGTLRVWDMKRDRLLDHIQIGHRPIEMLQLHPRKSIAAVLEVSENDGYILSVWNWEKERKLFSRELNEKPLYLSFSRQGSYLIYSLPQWRSIRILDADSGLVMPYLQNGFGIVSFFLTNSSETTLMAYTTQGRVLYLGIENGKQIRVVEGLPESLKTIFLTSSSRYACGYRDGKLFLFDIYDRNRPVELETPLFRDATYHQESDTFFGIVSNKDSSTSNSEVKINQYNLDPSGKTIELQNEILLQSSTNGTLTANSDSLFTTGNDGEIYRFQHQTKSNALFSDNALRPIYNLGLKDSKLFLATSNSILTLETEAFAKPAEQLLDTEEVNLAEYLLPWQKGETGLQLSNRDTLFVWRETGNEGKLMEFDTEKGKPIFGPINTPRGISDVEPSGRNFIILENNGRIKRIEPASFFPLNEIVESIPEKAVSFQYLAIGAQTILQTDSRTLLVGKNRSQRFRDPLLKINLNTGETIPISGNMNSIYELVMNDRNKSLFSIGMRETSSGKISTTLNRHTLYNPGQQREIFSYDGRDSNASMVFDDTSDRLYFTIGYNSLHYFDGRRSKDFPVAGDVIPRQLAVNEEYLISLNRDSTVSLWDKDRMQNLVTFYLFKDGRWLAVFGSEGYFGSPGIEDRITVVQDGKPLPSFRNSRFRLGDR
ncbi:MAG: WD40 repeat domain-containing protein [Spirochaetales bacterium]|nr:WD40 repeat domain-containing protein [Spirochaetales bacterium]MCF7937482.1 WD40 repeat domain-containing protein [Spirochaetales bacterium]